jgi:hypothetical protein
MEPEAHSCGCGRSFTAPGPLKFHQRTCKSTKKRLNIVLAKARELWESRKRPRLDEETGSLRNMEDEPIPRPRVVADLPAPPAIPDVVSHQNYHGFCYTCLTGHSHSQREDHNMTQTTLPDDEDLSLAERRPRRLNSQLPKRFRDTVPQPQPPIMSISGSYRGLLCRSYRSLKICSSSIICNLAPCFSRQSISPATLISIFPDSSKYIRTVKAVLL